MGPNKWMFLLETIASTTTTTFTTATTTLLLLLLYLCARKQWMSMNENITLMFTALVSFMAQTILMIIIDKLLSHVKCTLICSIRECSYTVLHD